MKALQDLENAASGDAAVRQKIASLPQEVQDVSLLEKITGEVRLKGNICAWYLEGSRFCDIGRQFRGGGGGEYVYEGRFGCKNTNFGTFF